MNFSPVFEHAVCIELVLSTLLKYRISTVLEHKISMELKVESTSLSIELT